MFLEYFFYYFFYSISFLFCMSCLTKYLDSLNACFMFFWACLTVRPFCNVLWMSQSRLSTLCIVLLSIEFLQILKNGKYKNKVKYYKKNKQKNKKKKLHFVNVNESIPEEGDKVTKQIAKELQR